MTTEAKPEIDIEAPRRAKLRAELEAQFPRHYSPWFHLAFPSAVGIGVIVAAALQLHAVQWWEILFAVAVFVFSNAAEWRVHRDLLHKRTWPFEFLFDRHTPEHHSVFVTHDMAIRSTKEFRLVLIPPYAILLIAAATLPIWAALWYVGHPNLAAFYVIVNMGYTVTYEWLHLSYHLDPDGFIGRRWLIRKLRHHHAVHHAPELMQKWNFNVSLPLWDWVRGTIYRGERAAR